LYSRLLLYPLLLLRTPQALRTVGLLWCIDPLANVNT
jgi:hypothetical protein